VDDIPLNEWDSRTLDGSIYTTVSEMYQLGNLLRREYSHMIVSGQGKDFMASLSGKSMTAGQALNHEWIHALP
jgi:hypothetical protein